MGFFTSKNQGFIKYKIIKKGNNLSKITFNKSKSRLVKIIYTQFFPISKKIVPINGFRIEFSPNKD